jgi:hypothetical protein
MMTHIFLIVLLFGGTANADLFETKAKVSVLREYVKKKPSHEKEAALDRKFDPYHTKKRSKENFVKRAKNMSNVNEERMRLAQLKKSITQKVLPHYGVFVLAAELFKVSESSIVASILTENAVATNNKDKVQEVVGSLATFAEAVIGEGDIPTSYSSFAEKIEGCDKGNKRGCEECKDLPFSERFICYSSTIGEPKFPGIGQTYGPVQMSLKSCLHVADREGLFDSDQEQGVFGPMPETFEGLFMKLQVLVHRMDAAIYLVAATHRMSIDYYAAKGWDISTNNPVLATLYNMGDIANRAKKASPPGGLYYPGTNFFGDYTYLIEEAGLIHQVVSMGRELSRVKEQGLDEKAYLKANLVSRTKNLVDSRGF